MVHRIVVLVEGVGGGKYAPKEDETGNHSCHKEEHYKDGVHGGSAVRTAGGKSISEKRGRQQ